MTRSPVEAVKTRLKAVTADGCLHQTMCSPSGTTAALILIGVIDNCVHLVTESCSSPTAPLTPMLVISKKHDVQYKLLLQAPLKVSHPFYQGARQLILHSFCCLSEASMEHAQGHRAETSNTLFRFLPIIELSPAFRRFDSELACNVVASSRRPVSTPYPYTDFFLHHI